MSSGTMPACAEITIDLWWHLIRTPLQAFWSGCYTKAGRIFQASSQAVAGQLTLVRFDAAYHSLFKCNLRRLTDYPALSAYLARFLTVPGVRETANIDHIKRGYHSIKALNPTGIVPVGSDLPGFDPVALPNDKPGRRSPWIPKHIVRMSLGHDLPCIL
jgi:hypothetical protein